MPAEPKKTQRSKQPKAAAKMADAPRRVRILVSSVVHGYADFLESVYAILEEYGYEVVMSHRGTVPINPDISAMSSCEEAVDGCDIFLGIILPRYGSGREEGNPYSITHRETIRAIERNKPRWFLVHEHVVIARDLLSPYRDENKLYDESKRPSYVLKEGIKFQATPYLQDLRVLGLYELAMRHDKAQVRDRKGNWVQPFATDEDARLFATTQFRRYREIEQRYLPKLKPLATPALRRPA